MHLRQPPLLLLFAQYTKLLLRNGAIIESGASTSEILREEDAILVFKLGVGDTWDKTVELIVEFKVKGFMKLVIDIELKFEIAVAGPFTCWTRTTELITFFVKFEVFLVLLCWARLAIVCDVCVQ